MHADEAHAAEVHADEAHAAEVHADEADAAKVHAYKIHAHKVHICCEQAAFRSPFVGLDTSAGQRVTWGFSWAGTTRGAMRELSGGPIRLWRLRVHNQGLASHLLANLYGRRL
jgi:hypothetical protein